MGNGQWYDGGAGAKRTAQNYNEISELRKSLLVEMTMTRSRYSSVSNVYAFRFTFLPLSLSFLISKRRMTFFALAFATVSGISFRNFVFSSFAAPVGLLYFLFVFLFTLLLNKWIIYFPGVCMSEKTSNCPCCCCCMGLWLRLRLLLLPLLFLVGSSDDSSSSLDFCVHIFIYLFVCFVHFSLACIIHPLKGKTIVAARCTETETVTLCVGARTSIKKILFNFKFIAVLGTQYVNVFAPIVVGLYHFSLFFFSILLF